MSRDLAKRPPRTKTYMTVLLIAVLLVGSAMKTGVDFAELVTGLPEMKRILREMFPPNWGYFGKIVDPMLDTIRMALLGTTFGAILAIPLIFLAAANVSKSPFIYQPARFVMNLIRTVPDLLLAGIFVAIFGIGPIPGILALVFFSLGFFAKLAYESIEAIDPGPLEAMTAVGANKWQWIQYGVVPQVLPAFIAHVLYTFEVNIRGAAILGFVGAGGIGLILEQNLGRLKYDNVMTIILFTLLIVWMIDFVSTRLREKLL